MDGMNGQQELVSVEEEAGQERCRNQWDLGVSQSILTILGMVLEIRKESANNQSLIEL